MDTRHHYLARPDVHCFSKEPTTEKLNTPPSNNGTRLLLRPWTEPRGPDLDSGLSADLHRIEYRNGAKRWALNSEHGYEKVGIIRPAHHTSLFYIIKYARGSICQCTEMRDELQCIAEIGGIARRKSIFDSPCVLVSPREVLFSLPQNQDAAERASVPRHGYGATTDKASRGRALTGPPNNRSTGLDLT